ncbi:MerR family transcriptional regulator [Actinomadura formosensis]|uniref:MerR family transcriptional regulator n=1 Tax=Actinomadura formosensis TaxID=60706 RepID=UPI000831CEDA|nr:MerR family transcriptional regulator [Actinomadura formosensis]
MRIGELAALVGVSSRTVRHYHRLGLPPEPERRANGYREHRLRDAVLLARIRRLTELGLSPAEISDVLADDQGRELREVLVELDADLARQQQAIEAGRARLAALLAEAELRPDSAVSPEMAEVLRGLPHGSGFAELDRGLPALVDTASEPTERARFAEMLRPLAEPEASARAAEDLAAYLPPELAALLVEHGADTGWLDELSAAQREVFRSLVAILKDRSC